jgi:hypothetical protein
MWFKDHHGDTDRAVLDAFLGGASTTRNKFIPFLNDVPTDRYFGGTVRTVCTVSDAPKVEHAAQ